MPLSVQYNSKSCTSVQSTSTSFAPSVAMPDRHKSRKLVRGRKACIRDEAMPSCNLLDTEHHIFAWLIVTALFAQTGEGKRGRNSARRALVALRGVCRWARESVDEAILTTHTAKCLLEQAPTVRAAIPPSMLHMICWSIEDERCALCHVKPCSRKRGASTTWKLLGTHACRFCTTDVIISARAVSYVCRSDRDFAMRRPVMPPNYDDVPWLMQLMSGELPDSDANWSPERLQAVSNAEFPRPLVVPTYQRNWVDQEEVRAMQTNQWAIQPPISTLGFRTHSLRVGGEWDAWNLRYDGRLWLKQRRAQMKDYLCDNALFPLSILDAGDVNRATKNLQYVDDWLAVRAYPWKSLVALCRAMKALDGPRVAHSNRNFELLQTRVMLEDIMKKHALYHRSYTWAQLLEAMRRRLDIIMFVSGDGTCICSETVKELFASHDSVRSRTPEQWKMRDAAYLRHRRMFGRYIPHS